MKSIWLINQFANIPCNPGHTRQFEISKGLIKKNWNVSVFASDFNLSSRRFLYLKNFQIILHEKYSGIFWNWLRVFPYLKNDWKRYLNIFSFCINLFLILFLKISYLKIISSKKLPHVILASSPQLPAAFLSLIIAKLFRIPFILEIRDLWPQSLIELGGIKRNNIFIKLCLFIERILYKNSNAIVVLSKGSIKYIHDRGGKNIHWLPNGPDLDLFKFRKLPYKEFFNKESPFHILYAGTIGLANGIDNIINAAILLQGKPIKFYILGDGPEKIKLKNRALNLENIIFEDPIPKSQIPNRIAKSDVVLVNLKKIDLFSYGVSPNKLYDAYSIGRPVIVTIPGIVKEEVEKNKIGMFAKPDDAKSLAQVVERMFNLNLCERQKMAMRARELAENTYSRQKIIDSYNKLIINQLKII